MSEEKSVNNEMRYENVFVTLNFKYDKKKKLKLEEVK